MTNVEKLAEALRGLLAHVEDHKVAATRGGGVGAFKYEGTPYERVAKAREVLAEYEEARCAPKSWTVRTVARSSDWFVFGPDECVLCVVGPHPPARGVRT